MEPHLALPCDTRFPDPFPWPPAGTPSIPANYHCATPEIEQKLADYLESSGQQSSISTGIYRLAEQLGIKVTVMSNEEYDKQYPGTGGVTVGAGDAREVIIPERSLDDPANTTLEHELMHAYVELDSSPGKTLYETAVDSSRSPAERQAAAEQLFESIGGTGEQGRAWLEGLEGIPQHVIDATGDHMLNSATDRLIYRQKAGESLETPETLAIMRNAAKGEAAMHLLGRLNPDDGQKPGLWTVFSVYMALQSMYGADAPDYRGGSMDDIRSQMSDFLETRIQTFNDTRDAYATNR